MSKPNAVIILTILSLAVYASANAATRFVDTVGSDDLGNDCLDRESPCGTVSHAVSQTSSGDTIQLGPGIFTEPNGILITTDLELTGHGPGTILQAASEPVIAQNPVITVDPSSFDADVVISDMTVRHGWSGNTGGGMNVTNNINGSIEIRNVTFAANKAWSGGGGIHLGPTQEVTLTNVSIVSNLSLLDGGGLYIAGFEPVLTNVTFNGNHAERDGGGLFVATGGPVIRNAIFWENQDQSSVSDASIYTGNATPTVSHSLVKGCNPDGVWNENCGEDMGSNLADVDPGFIESFDPDNAPSFDGDVRIGAESLALEAGNNAFVADVEFDIAGFPRIEGNAVDLGVHEWRPEPDEIVRYADPEGFDGDPHEGLEQMNDCLAPGYPCATVYHSVQQSGFNDIIELSAGQFREPNGVTIDKILTIRGAGLGTRVKAINDWYESTSRVFTISGQGLSVELKDLDIAFGSDEIGAGLYSNGNFLTITNVAFSGNRATGSGGGAYIANGEAELSNVLFLGNRALDGDGGGLHVDSVELSMTNASFSANSAAHAGGGMSNESGDIVIRNSIFYKNQDQSGTGTSTSSLANIDPAATSSISHSMIQGCHPPEGWSTACGVDEGNNPEDVDPEFVTTPDPDKWWSPDDPDPFGNLRLSPGSPMIEVGNDDFVQDLSTDLDGNPRIQGDQVDLGAFEWSETIFSDRFQLARLRAHHTISKPPPPFTQ